MLVGKQLVYKRGLTVSYSARPHSESAPTAPPKRMQEKGGGDCCGGLTCANSSVARPITMPTTPATFYMKSLPESCIAFSSKNGRDLFTQALASGTMQIYFKLAEQFRTQDEPAFCGLASIAMCLNALSVDPRRPWKGPWRWFTETLLDCCEPLDVVKRDGIVFSQAACLARCNGATVEERPFGSFSLAEFRESVAAVCAAEEPGANGILLLSYSRKGLGQTGDGHFSPVGGYHRDKDMILILDVASFKYAPHWVTLEDMYKAMSLIDSTTGRPRGFMVLRPSKVKSVLFTLGVQAKGFEEGLRFLQEGSYAAADHAAASLRPSEAAGRLAALRGASDTVSNHSALSSSAKIFYEKADPVLAAAADEAIRVMIASLPVSGLDLIVSRVDITEIVLHGTGCHVTHEQAHVTLSELRSTSLFKVVQRSLGIPSNGARTGEGAGSAVPRGAMSDAAPQGDAGRAAAAVAAAAGPGCSEDIGDLFAERTAFMLFLLPSEVWERFPDGPLRAVLQDLTDLKRDSRSLLRTEVGYCRAQLKEMRPEPGSVMTAEQSCCGGVA